MHNHHKPLIDALFECVNACEHCALESYSEQPLETNIHRLLLNRDCADLCTLTARFVARGSAYSQYLLAQCADVCRAYSKVCEESWAGMKHCQNCCVDACRRCEQACRAALMESVSPTAA